MGVPHFLIHLLLPPLHGDQAHYHPEKGTFPAALQRHCQGIETLSGNRDRANGFERSLCAVHSLLAVNAAELPHQLLPLQTLGSGL